MTDIQPEEFALHSGMIEGAIMVSIRAYMEDSRWVPTSLIRGSQG